MKKKILITGSSGYSGNETANLLKDEYDIIGIDLTPGIHTSHIGSLSDIDLVLSLTEGVEAVIHTASLHAPHINSHSRKNFINTNIFGTLNLLEAAEENQVKKFIYTSTTSLYGESMVDDDQAVWVTEKVATLPRDIYDITKIAAEGLCKDFFNKDGMQTTVLRVSRFWNEPPKDKIFYRMYRGLDVRDVAYAHQLAIDKIFDQFEIYNISAQSIFTKEDLPDLKNNLNQLLEERIPEILNLYKEKNWKIPDAIDRVYVIDKAKKELGFNPKYNIREMLDEDI